MTTVLILGGLGQDGPRQLLPFLLSSAGPSPAFVRVVDKYLIIPAADAYTTYIDADARAALKSPLVEYVQGNLLTEATRTKAFALPTTHSGPEKGFDYVFDFTGEADYTLSETVHLERTLRLAILLGQSAASSHVGAYVRLLASQYKLADGKKGQVGGEGQGVAEPWGTRATWHHEAARSLAQIKGLNLVLLRPALFYGPYSTTGMTPRVLIGEVYRFIGEKLEFLWKDTLPLNTLHINDFCAAAVQVARWTFEKGSTQVLELAGELLPATLSSDNQVKDVPGAAKKKDVVRAAVFNLVDDAATTQGLIAKVISEVVGVDAGFHGSIISSFARLNMSDVLEDVNDKHLEGWSALLTASKPPISTTIPISPNVPADLLQPFAVSFSGEKVTRVVGWKPSRRFDAASVKDSVAKFKAEGNWPNAPPKSKK